MIRRVGTCLLATTVAASVGSLACGGSGHRPTAVGEPHEGAAEDMYRRCTTVMEQTQCGTGPSDQLQRDFGCIRRISNGYYELDTYVDRQRYLVQQGCPPAMVYGAEP